MKLFGLSICSLLLCIGSAGASVPDWRLTKVSVTDGETRTLLVETSLTIHWDGVAPLRLIAYHRVVEADIKVSDDRGHLLAKVISNGPGAAFQKTVMLRRGQSRSFGVFSCGFTFRHPGTFTATGRLVGGSPRGKAVAIDLGKLYFTIAKAALKAP